MHRRAPLLVSLCLLAACGTKPSADGSDTLVDPDRDTDVSRDTDTRTDTDVSPDTDPGVDTARVGEVTINEVSCRSPEWVELAITNANVDLGGYRLTDTPDVAGSGVVFPAGSIGRAWDLLTVDALGFGVDCDGDTLALFDATGAEVDRVTIAPQLVGQTWGRLPDATGAWSTTAPSQAAPNAPWVRLDDSALFDPYRPFEVALTLPPGAVNALAIDPRTYTNGRARIVGFDGTTLFNGQIGIRIKGQYGSARTLDGKAALKLDLNWNGSGGSALGVHKLTLNNMVQDGSKIHEWLAYSLFRAQGVPTPRTGYAHVTLNGSDMGLYLNIETLDDVLVPRTFPSTQHLYEGKYGQDLVVENVDDLEVDMGSEGDRGDLEALIAVMDAAPYGHEWEAAAPYLDEPEVITTLAIETWIGHWDGYGPTRNNYSFHFDDQGVLTLLASGTDQTFGSYIDMFSGQGRLLNACLTDAVCWMEYATALDDLMVTLDGRDFETELRNLSAFLRPRLVADPRRESSVEDYDAGLEATIDFLYGRRAEAGPIVDCELDPTGDVDGDGAWCRRDCLEGDPTIHPGAVDVCGDKIDQDCSGWPDDDPSCPDCTPLRVAGHRYLACSTPRTWAEAEANCAAQGSALMIPNTPAEQGVAVRLRTMARDQDSWLGLTDAAVEGTWLGVDGSPVSYAPWASGQPNDSGGQDCGLITVAGDWNDQPCTRRTPSLCEDACTPGQDDDHDGHLRCGDDCDDTNPTVYAGAPEICGDGIDQDCDGRIDGQPSCPDCVTQTIGGAGTYAACPAPRTWYDGRAQCQALGMDLVSIDSTFENGKVWAFAQSVEVADYWIGRNDLASEGSFVDADGTTSNFKAWSPGEPNDWGGYEDCAHFWSGSAVWNDNNCDVGMGTLCERP